MCKKYPSPIRERIYKYTKGKVLCNSIFKKNRMAEYWGAHFLIPPSAHQYIKDIF